jgi:hypothetical protein
MSVNKLGPPEIQPTSLSMAYPTSVNVIKLVAVF